MIFIIDFDGTITLRDTVDALLERFADPYWEVLEKNWIDGKINSQTCMREQLALVQANKETLKDFFDDIEIDPTFDRLVHYLRTFAKVAIVSDGLDHSIHHSISKVGLSFIPVFANKVTMNEGMLNLSFPHVDELCLQKSGVCKCAVARSFDTSPIILIGDGKSDHCLARYADYVFAKGSLQSFCKRENIPYTSFTLFNDLLPAIQQWRISHSLPTVKVKCHVI